MNIMSIISKITPKSTVDPNILDLHELEFILTSLKSVTITGDQVEMFYNLVVKLQNQYIDKQKK
jgi:hypothetical protein